MIPVGENQPEAYPSIGELYDAAEKLIEETTQLKAVLMEYTHALKEVAACDEDPFCASCKRIAQSALDHLNLEMCLELVQEGFDPQEG